MAELEADEDLKEAIQECAKIIEEKCKKRPYMVIVTKADVGFANEQDMKKGIIKGKASFLYAAKPNLKADGLSKILIGASKKALEMAEKQAEGLQATTSESK